MKILQSLIFRRNYRWFDKNRRKIVTGHEGEFVLVEKKKMWGYYDSIRSAHLDAKRRGFVNGRYMVHECKMEEPVYYM